MEFQQNFGFLCILPIRSFLPSFHIGMLCRFGTESHLASPTAAKRLGLLPHVTSGCNEVRVWVWVRVWFASQVLNLVSGPSFKNFQHFFHQSYGTMEDWDDNALRVNVQEPHGINSFVILHAPIGPFHCVVSVETCRQRSLCSHIIWTDVVTIKIRRLLVN